MQARPCILSRRLQISALSAALALLPQFARAQDPPPGDTRLGHLEGSVTVQQAGLESWGLADPNMPIGPGDRVFADPRANSEGELQAGPTRTFFGPGADVTLTDFGPRGVEIGIASGSAFFFSDGFTNGQALFVSTPNGGIAVGGRGGFRVDVFPDQQTTVVTNLPNWDALHINGGGGFAAILERNQSIQLTGTNPVYAQPLAPNPPDPFEHWAGAIESQHQNAVSLRYVNPGMVGYADLDRAGDWQPESPYGPIWFPRVEAGWAPYHNGHWVNRPFYGWVWVADEPWGAAPFHYGRWVVVGNRWGWVPGPRDVAPVWSPAQVVFAGGITAGGAGLSVWFPLGPGEPYKPWYPCSPRYIDQVNISNIHPSPTIRVQNTYVNIVNVTYINRTVGVTAMRQEDFAAGHPAARASVRIDVNLVQHVQAAAPAARPPAQPVITHPVARPPAVQAARPVLINHQGQQVAATANARPVAVPVKAAPPAPKPLPGRQAAGNPTLGGRPVTPAAAGRPAAAAQPGKAATPAAPPAVKTAPAPAERPLTPAAKSQPAPAARPQPTPAAKPAVPAERPIEKPNSKDPKRKPNPKEDKKTHPEKPEE